MLQQKSLMLLLKFQNLKMQTYVAMLTLENLLNYADITDDNVLQLCKNLWSLSQKYGYQDAKFSVGFTQEF